MKHGTRCLFSFISLVFFCLAAGGVAHGDNEGRQVDALASSLKELRKAMAKRDQDIERLFEQQRRLRRCLEERDREIAQLRRMIEAKDDTASGETQEGAGDSDGVKVSYGGQYRINSYAVGDGVGGSSPTASRLRIRQNLDFEFGQGLETHLQFELGHTNANVGTTDKELRVRHAVIGYSPAPWLSAKAGILPLSDRFDDMLFSSDWDYNPLALSFEAGIGPGLLRAFAGELNEGDEPIAHDDFIHYQLDYTVEPVPGWKVAAGLTYADVAAPSESQTRPVVNGAFSLALALSEGYRLKATVLGSYADGSLLAAKDDAFGAAARLEFTGGLGGGDFGLLATYASGEKDGTGFLPLMAFSRTYGYWGYTGLLTVQGPTDTGFDGDAVNISNNGYGLASLQVRYLCPIGSRLSAYAAAGWFGASDTPSGRSSFLGQDYLLMFTYHLSKVLSLDLGGAYARIENSVSGYGSGVFNGASFTSPKGQVRDKTAFFTRLQAEF